MAQDDVSLSEQERRTLASLEARAENDDPDLAVRLRGAQRRHWAARVRKATVWLAPVLAVAGVALMLTTVAVSPWAAGAGVVLLGIAMWLAIDWARRRWLTKRGTTGHS
jgi:hypothetical protein